MIYTPHHIKGYDHALWYNLYIFTYNLNYNYFDCTSVMYCVAMGVLNYTVCMYQVVRMCACFALF